MIETPAQRFAAFAAGMSADALPEDVREAAKLHLLDTLGCALAADALAVGGEPREALARRGLDGPATVIGGGRASAAEAALANGTLSHALDFDDTHADSVCHVSVVVCAAALAAAEAERASGANLLAAIVAGNEIVTRLAMATPSAFHERGFHPTSVCGVFGAAAAASRLGGLDAPHTTNALGIAGSMASGIFEYLADGSSTKPIHAGWAAHGGVVAALLAGVGATGPKTVIEGRFGLYSAYLDRRDVDLERQLDDLGARWETLRIAFKLYPACHFVHGVLGAASEILAERPLGADEIESMRVLIPQPGVALVLDPPEAKAAPRTPYDAKFSLPYSLAALVVHGRVDLTTYTESAIRNPEVLELARRVSYSAAEYATYPGAFPGTVELQLRDGTMLKREHIHQLGGPDNPVGQEAIRAKFIANAVLALPTEQAEQLADTVLSLEELEDVRSLLEPMRARVAA